MLDPLTTSAEAIALVELMNKAIEASPPEEVDRALEAAEVIIRTMVRTELRAPET